MDMQQWKEQQWGREQRAAVSAKLKHAVAAGNMGEEEAIHLWRLYESRQLWFERQQDMQADRLLRTDWAWDV